MISILQDDKMYNQAYKMVLDYFKKSGALVCVIPPGTLYGHGKAYLIQAGISKNQGLKPHL